MENHDVQEYLTAEVPGTGGTIKDSPDDFLVTEIPLYLPCGEGEHCYLEIEKRGLTTLEAVRRIARELSIRDRDIGYAGMKDAVGVTRQTISVPRVPPERLLALRIPGVTPLSARFHRNKLKLGHLSGNRFLIVIRGVDGHALDLANDVLGVLARRGVPNFFGMQRYGAQGNSHRIGMAWLAGDYRRTVASIIGNPEAVRNDRWREAIEAFNRGDLQAAVDSFPGHCRTEREVVMRLVKHPGDWKRALKAVDPRLRSLYFSAAQSTLFDQVLAARLESLDQVRTGDIACKHDNGACFVVEDGALEAERARTFGISPTGPLFGGKMLSPRGAVLELEEAVLKKAGLTMDDFRSSEDWPYEGSRRPLRIPLVDPAASQSGDCLTLSFSLPAGAYATAVAREVMKT